MALALCCMSHSPLLNVPGPSAELLEDVEGALSTARDFVAEYDPELVVIFSPDHYNGFFYKMMPAFCIGTAATGVGDYGTQTGPLDVPATLATELAEHVLDAGVDVAISAGMDVDHGTVQPLEKLFGDATAVPVIPIFINSVATPLGPLHRSKALGAAVGTFLAGLDQRVLVVGSGGLSHDPPVPTLKTAAPAALERIVHGAPMTPEQRRARQDSVAAAAREFAAGQGALPAAQPGLGPLLPRPDGHRPARRARQLDQLLDRRRGRQLRTRGPHVGGRVRRARRPGPVPHRRPLLPGRPRTDRRVRGAHRGADRSRPVSADSFDACVDVLVIGSGGGGMTAALAAHAAGLDTLVVEKGSQFGGSTALSGGGIWVPGAPSQKREGYAPDPDGVKDYLRQITDGLVSDERISAYVDHAPEMMEFLEKTSRWCEFVWKPGYADYYPELPGGSELGSTINVPPIDLRVLGDEEANLLKPLALAPKGIWLGPKDLRLFYQVRQNWRGKAVLVKLLWRKFRAHVFGDRIAAIGQSLAARLRLAMKEQDIPLWLDAPMTELITDVDGAVVGAVVERVRSTAADRRPARGHPGHRRFRPRHGLAP